MPLPPSTDVDTSGPQLKVPANADDVFDLLNDDKAGKPDDSKDDDNEVEDKPAKKEAKKEDKEDVEEVDLEDNDEEGKIKLKDADDIEDTEDDEVPDDIAPPRLKELETAYPGITKKYPFIAKMLARDKAYNELFGSFDDARQLHSDHQELTEKAEIFADFEAKLLDGDTTDILKNVKETDPKAFDRIVDEYLTNLHSVDKDAYIHVVNGVAKQIIFRMYSDGKEADDDELRDAAAVLNKYLFRTTKFQPHERRTEERSKDKNTKDDSVTEERRALVQERYTDAKTALTTKVDNVLRATISSYIDPKKVMGDYVRNKAVSDTVAAVHAVLDKNEGLRRNIDSLWKAAFGSKFDKQSMGRIQAAYLGASKKVIANEIRKVRALVLKDINKKPKEDKDDDDDDREDTTPQNSGKKHAGRPARDNKGDKNKMRQGESVVDFLSRD